VSCETLYLTGIARENLGIPATVYPNVLQAGEVLEVSAVQGRVTMHVLTATVDETVYVTGKCRQA
jgi:hypothetical protein